MHLAAAWEIAQDTLLNLSRYEGRVLARYRRALDRWKEIKKARAADVAKVPADVAQPPSDVAQAPAQALLPARLDTPVEPLNQSPPPNPAAPAAEPIAQNEPNSTLTPVPATPARTTKTPPEAA